MKKESEKSKRIKDLLTSVVEHFDEEDRPTREAQINHYRQLKLYWNNASRIYYSETARDYRIAAIQNDSPGSENDQAYYDRPVNVFRAFLETIIAALSIQIPAIACIPDNAENPVDLSTAKAGDKISELIYKHNDVAFLWLHALYVYCTEGMIACYSYPRKNKEYGTHKTDKYEDTEEDSIVCSNCNERIPDDMIPIKEDENGEAVAEAEEENPVLCPNCEEPIDLTLPRIPFIVPKFIGVTEEAKTRICLEVYGGLNVKVANYARCQAETPYLTYSFETHYANAMEWHPDLRDEIPDKQSGAGGITGSYEPNELNARSNPQYIGEIPEHNVTIRQCWLRPAAYNILNEKDSEFLHKEFPKGVKATLVGEILVEFEEGMLDERWTLTQNPLSDYLTHDPLGTLLTNIQDIVNDLISLTLQTIEHGISELWADPAVVDFGSYNQIEAMPGTVHPTKSVSSSRRVSEAFFSTSSAALSPEVFNFYRIVQELGQFVSGALPSLFGGNPGNASSRTASEYSMSRGMAMQRLQTPWKMLSIWWKGIFTKVIPMYMENVAEDERLVEKDRQGNYINTFIRKSELGGKIGSVELENSEQLPISDEQKKEIIMQLMNLNNMEIMTALSAPENLPMIRKVIKIPEFRLPGEDDRQKQYEEINQLINSEPIEIPPDTEALLIADPASPPPPLEVTSVEVDPLVDNHEIEASICRTWLVGEAGRLAKLENPKGYKNVLLHMKAHMEIIQANAAAQAPAMPPAEAGAEAGAGKPNGKANGSGKPNGTGRPTGKPDEEPLNVEQDLPLQ